MSGSAASRGLKTDQYSLAVLFFQLKTSEVPFASVFDTGDPVLMMNVVGRGVVEVPLDLSKAMRFALSRALAKKREERFSSCKELVEALEGRGVSNAPKKWGLLAGITFLVAAIAGGIWYWNYRQNEQARIEPGTKAPEEAARLAAEAEVAERARIEALQKAQAEAAHNTSLAIKAFNCPRPPMT